MINIDETTINKDTTKWYSWLTRGKSWSILKVKFKNSVNFISAIWSDGTTINLIKYSKTNKESIIIFLRYLFDFITKTKKLTPPEVGIIWDNCSPHRVSAVRNLWKEKNAKIYYIPPYSPELAPVEIYFLKLKADIIRQAGWQLEK